MPLNEKWIPKIKAAYAPGSYDTSEIKSFGEGSKGSVLRVRCPDHGYFTISFENLVYLAGCRKCRGVHPRGYPLRRGPMPVPKPVGRRKREGGPKGHTLYLMRVGARNLEVRTTQPPADQRQQVVYSRPFGSARLLSITARLVNLGWPTLDYEHLGAILTLIRSAP